MKKVTLAHIYLLVSLLCILCITFYLRHERSEMNDKYLDNIKESFVVDDTQIDVEEFLSNDADLILSYWNQCYGRMRVVKVKDDRVTVYLVTSQYAMMYEDTNLKNMPNSFSSLFCGTNNTYRIEWKHTSNIDDEERAEILKYRDDFIKTAALGYEAAEDDKQHTSMHKYWNRIYVLTNGKMYSSQLSFDDQDIAVYLLKYFKEYTSAYPDGWGKIMEFYYKDK